MPTPPPDPPDTPDVPTAPATLTSADVASILVGQAILAGAAPPQVYAGIIRELTQLRARVAELEAGIRQHRDAKGHDRCHLDDRTLYALLPGEPPGDQTLPPRCEFLAECERYWENRRP